MVGDPNRWANTMARMGGGRTAVPSGLSGMAAQAGHAAHQAREEHAAAQNLIGAQRGLNQAVERQKQSRRGGRLVLPPGFTPIPDDYETVATNALAPDGDISIASFGAAIQAALGQPDLSVADRKRLEARLKIFEIFLGSREDERFGKAAMLIGGVAAEGDAFTPRAPWVALYALSAAATANIPGASEAMAKFQAAHPDRVTQCIPTLVQFVRLQVVHLGSYVLVQPNNNISPITYRFVFDGDGTATGTIVKVDHIMARGPLGFFSGMAGLQNIANQMVQGTQFTGKWRLDIARPQHGGPTKRVLQLDLWQQTPFGVTSDFNRDIEIAGVNGPVRYGYSPNDGDTWFLYEEPPAQAPAPPPDPAPKKSSWLSGLFARRGS